MRKSAQEAKLIRPRSNISFQSGGDRGGLAATEVLTGSSRVQAQVFVNDDGDDDDDAKGEEVKVQHQGEICEAAEETEVRRVLPTPDMPSKSDVDKHRIDHLPYASWCEDCVEGCGIEFGHSTSSKESHSIPVIGFDYMFLTSKDVLTKAEWMKLDASERDPYALKVLVVRDTKSKCLFAHGVPQKGVDEGRFAVSALVDDIKWMGYSKLLLKSDNEPAIVALLREALKALRVEGVEQVSAENPPPYDPQSNGGTEIGVKLVKNMWKVLRSCIERRLGFVVPSSHPVMHWMVRHAADLRNWRVKGHDGKTAYERVRGRPFVTR